jgi:hypothetical protein
MPWTVSGEARGRLARYGRRLLWWAALVVLVVSVALIKWPQFLGVGVPWWGLFWSGGLLALLALHLTHRETISEMRKGLSERDSQIAELKRAVEGEQPTTGAGIKYLRQSCNQTKPDSETAARLLKNLRLPQRPPYYVSLTIFTKEDIPAAILVKWSRPVVRGTGEYRDRRTKKNYGASARSLDQRTVVYDFSLRTRRAIPIETVVTVTAYTPDFGAYAVHVEAYHPDRQ